MSRPLLLGHRGARGTRSIPENTLESFDLALTQGCDGFEFDVRRTADGHAVICHDPIVHGVDVARSNLADLRNVPQLEPVLACYSQRAFLDIELKVAGLEALVVEALRACPSQRGYVVSSFLPEALLALRGLDQNIPLGVICEDKHQLAAWKQLPVQFVIAHHSLVDEALCRILANASKRILVWTVNTREQILRLSSNGVDGIISDDTALLVTTLRGSG